MEFTVKIEGRDNEHWILCPGRSAVEVSVRWRPTGQPGDAEAPLCHLSYLGAPGSVPSGLPATIPMRRGDDAWNGQTSLEAPPFAPLRVRVEIRPAYQRHQAVILHVIPKPSAWIASGLVSAALVLAAVLLAMTFATLRMTILQAATQLSSVALLAAAFYLLRRALAALRPDHLPFLGVTYLIHRAALVCAVGFLALFAALQSCFVAIENHSGGPVTLNLPGLDGGTTIGANARITVMPPSTTELRTDLLSFRAGDSVGLPLCVDDFDDPFEQAAPCLDDRTYVRPTLRARLSAWFTPPTLQIRCGGRWPELTREQIVDNDPRVRIEGDAVWITAESDAVCGSRPTYLWYRHGDGGVHHVRFPWRPSELGEGPSLFVSQVAHTTAADPPKGVTLVTRRSDSETRVALSAGQGDDSRGYALLTDLKEDTLALELGDALRRITDPLATTATLACHHSPGARVFQATRLAQSSPGGWLVELATSSPQGLSWSSTWKLLGASIVDPWICEALPGDDPTYSQRIPFAPDHLTLVLDESVREPQGQALLLPAYLMSRRVEIKRRRPDGPQLDSIGRLDCSLNAERDKLIAVGAVRLDDHRGGTVRDFTVETAANESIGWRPIDPPSVRPDFAWLCWHHDPAARIAEVTVTHKDGATIKGSWDIPGAKLTLTPQGRTLCYLDPSTPLTPVTDLKSYHKVRLAPDAPRTLAAFHHCDEVWILKKKEAP
jgi:hypothetical protein